MKWTCAVAIAALALFGLGCVQGVALEGKACDGSHPCVEGYRCTAEGLCVVDQASEGEGEGEGEDELMVVPVWGSSLWGDWIDHDTGTRCTGDEDALPGFHCVHSGEALAALLPDGIGCGDVWDVQDELGAFGWSCEDGTPAQIVSEGLRVGAGLHQLVDTLGEPAFLAERLYVALGSGAILTSAPRVWWSNPVLVETDGNATVPDSVVIVDSGFAGVFHIGANGVSAIAVGSIQFDVTARSRVWLEGLLSSSGATEVIDVTDSTLVVINASSVSGAAQAEGIDLLRTKGVWVRDSLAFDNLVGIDVDDSDFVGLQRVTAARNRNHGVTLLDSWRCVLSEVDATQNLDAGASDTGYGVLLTDSSLNVLERVIASHNAEVGVGLVGPFTKDNLLIGMSILGNRSGLEIEDANANVVMSSVVVNNEDGVQFFGSAEDNVLHGVAVTDNIDGIYAEAGTLDNLIGGRLVLGNSDDCAVEVPEALALDPATCAPTDPEVELLRTGLPGSTWVGENAWIQTSTIDDWHLPVSHTWIAPYPDLGPCGDLCAIYDLSLAGSGPLRDAVPVARSAFTRRDGSGQLDTIVPGALDLEVGFCRGEAECLLYRHLGAWQGLDELVDSNVGGILLFAEP